MYLSNQNGHSPPVVHVKVENNFSDLFMIENRGCGWNGVLISFLLAAGTHTGRVVINTL